MVEFNKIAKKWQDIWEKAKIFEVKEDYSKKKFYVLEMYPYPSSHGLHMGHARNYCIGDAFARFKRMQGFNVLYPMGYDSFGLPAENAAIKFKTHPKIFTDQAISNFIRQQKELGLSYDWSRTVMSHDPNYYKWDQWIFLRMYEKGLVYRRKSVVNWCPQCNTVLANEQVHDGKCWRHSETNVETKDLEQWFFKITDYAQELLTDIDRLNGWSEDVKTMQRNWIGKSEGALIDFIIDGSDRKLTVFTTRPDTFFGITFLVYAPEHPDVMELVKGTKYEKPAKEFVRKVVLEDRFMRTAEDKEKEGMFIGKYAINPITKEKIPIFIANFVLHEYGTGAIIAVPAHDQRDFEFAKKYKIPIRVVINPPDYSLNPEKMSRAYAEEGIMTNSGEFDGMNNREAIPEFIKYFEKNKCGKGTVQYKIRDWLISRQRFWGCPIPMVYCDICGIIPIAEKDLPVILPDDVEFSGEGNPLANSKKFVNTVCPKCSGPARRETDTMDTFVDSSWYFLRYCDSKNPNLPFDPKKAGYWMPIDRYIGGKEHATMHLIYFRFFTKFLRDIGMLNVDEPSFNLFNQGMLHKNGVVMSKSRGNVVLPSEVAEKYGIDTVRLFLLFVAGPDKDMEWSDEGVEGAHRFLNKIYRIITEKKIIDAAEKREASRVHRTIKEVTECIENFKLNIALIRLLELANYLNNLDTISKDSANILIRLMCPFTPHICEELWESMGNKGFASLAEWPQHDESKIDRNAEALEEMAECAGKDIASVLKLANIEKPNEISLFVAEGWKFDLLENVKGQLEKSHDIKEILGNIMKTELRKHGTEITKLVPKLVGDKSRIPDVIFNQESEIKNLEECKLALEKEFNSKIIILKESDSKEQKAKQAMPGKVAILVK